MTPEGPRSLHICLRFQAALDAVENAKRRADALEARGRNKEARAERKAALKHGQTLLRTERLARKNEARGVWDDRHLSGALNVIGPPAPQFAKRLAKETRDERRRGQKQADRIRLEATRKVKLRQPWVASKKSRGPLREGILTVNRTWFAADPNTPEENHIDAPFCDQDGRVVPQVWDRKKVEWFKREGAAFLRGNFGDAVVDLRIDGDEAAPHFHFVIWCSEDSEQKRRANAKSPAVKQIQWSARQHPLIARYEAAQDAAGSWFEDPARADMGIVRGERRAAKRRAEIGELAAAELTQRGVRLTEKGTKLKEWRLEATNSEGARVIKLAESLLDADGKAGDIAQRVTIAHAVLDGFLDAKTAEAALKTRRGRKDLIEKLQSGDHRFFIHDVAGAKRDPAAAVSGLASKFETIVREAERRTKQAQSKAEKADKAATAAEARVRLAEDHAAQLLKEAQAAKGAAEKNNEAAKLDRLASAEKLRAAKKSTQATQRLLQATLDGVLTVEGDGRLQPKKTLPLETKCALTRDLNEVDPDLMIGLADVAHSVAQLNEKQRSTIEAADAAKNAKQATDLALTEAKRDRDAAKTERFELERRQKSLEHHIVEEAEKRAQTLARDLAEQQVQSRIEEELTRLDDGLDLIAFGAVRTDPHRPVDDKHLEVVVGREPGADTSDLQKLGAALKSTDDRAAAMVEGRWWPYLRMQLINVQHERRIVETAKLVVDTIGSRAVDVITKTREVVSAGLDLAATLRPRTDDESKAIGHFRGLLEKARKPWGQAANPCLPNLQIPPS